MTKNDLSKENSIRLSKLLIVEGNHERDFFHAWLKILNREDIQVMPIGGKTRLRANLAILVKQRLFLDGFVSSIVIVQDADDNPSSAFTSVQDAIREVGLPTPSRCLEMAQGNGLSVTIVVVPAADQRGALEELLLETVTEDSLLPLAITFIDTAITTLEASQQRNPPAPHRRGKAKVHAYLATFDEPDKDTGKAALAGVWNYTHHALTPLLTILQNM